MSRAAWRRIARLAKPALACACAFFLLSLLPDLIRFIPESVRAFWIEGLALVFVAAYPIAWRLTLKGPGGSRAADRARRCLSTIDSFAEWALRSGLALALGVLCLLLLAGWVPHYLTWPWSRDKDTFAVLAQSWDQGILPYRDIRAYNFPGQTYLFWVLGKLFGWGHAGAFYAFDAACVVLMGVVVVAWSRKRLGGAIPGLLGYVVFLRFYMTLAFEVVGERDWYTVFLVCVGLLSLQAWPGRAARMGSALAAALALALRPHAVLFLPALVAAVAEGTYSARPAGPGRARAILEWGLYLGIFVALAFAPLVAAGIADDFVAGLRVAAYGGPYNKAKPTEALEIFVEQLKDWRTDVPLVATLLLASWPSNTWSRMARTWLLAWLAALLYRPIHPVHHFYLVHAILLVGAITWAFPVAWLLSLQGPPRPVLVVGVALLTFEIIPERPWMCDLSESVRALRHLARREMPTRPPPGCRQQFPGYLGKSPEWQSYRQVLEFLRRSTSPRTLVANVLNRYPYESLNGPTARLSPFRAESGICWMTYVDIDLDPEFARALQDATDCVVVWEPLQQSFDARIKLERVIEVIRRYYEPEARFGKVEVWRRKAVGRA